MDAEEVLLSSMESRDDLVRSIKAFLAERNMSAKNFCEVSGMPQNTLYKILSRNRRDFMLSNMRRLIGAMREIDSGEGYSVGVITSRGALDNLQRVVSIEGRDTDLVIREYPATTIEEEIIQGIRAEREKMKGVICGPIAANTLEKVVRIPVIALQFKEDALLEALEKLSNKL
jgi:predicted transcriptional regulator